MRTTLNLNEEKIKEAAAATGVKEKTKLLHLGLDALIRDAAIRRLANSFGIYKKAKAPRRRRSPL
ncbi:type II toxin-antitoxin system VapB family antitoxin [bacterium]|nr:MAG: type II toxin-antitoxin system VapB family antitoxin [bacterium]